MKNDRASQIKNNDSNINLILMKKKWLQHFSSIQVKEDKDQTFQFQKKRNYEKYMCFGVGMMRYTSVGFFLRFIT